jgi:hypothetical protein
MKEIIIIALIVAASVAFKYYKIKNSSKVKNENKVMRMQENVSFTGS